MRLARVGEHACTGHRPGSTYDPRPTQRRGFPIIRTRWSSVHLLVSLILLLPAAAASANWLATESPFHATEPGSVGIGYAARFGHSPYRGVDNVGSVYNDFRYDLVPLYLYEGEWLFAHGTEAGAHLLRSGPFRLDLLASYRFERLQSEASDFLDGMDDRSQTVDAGLAGSLEGVWGRIDLRLLTDLLDRHGGEEVQLTYQIPWQRGRWSLTPWAGLVWKSTDLTRYYYGVEPDEVRPDRPLYRPDDAVNWQVGLNASYRLHENWLLFANAAYERLDDTVRASPTVDRKDLLSAYTGFAWSLGNTRRIETQAPGTRLWSWRVNAGYTVQDTFSQVLLGNFRQHRDVDTHLVGFTLGRLLKDGRRGDVWGRISINRRLENDFQEDFNEYVAYVMAIGSGYAPWTNRELFRFGFGIGISYAERVPAVEQFKQRGPDERTSHWLNYLEAMVDFPLRTLFGKRGSEHCYLGLSLVHRSGIFARVDFFNSTQGGSEVLTGHVECKF